MAIVKSKGSPYKDGMFPLGTNWEDYILWCLVEMGKECDRGEAAKIDSVHMNKMSSEFGLGNVVLGEEKQQVGGTVASNSASDSFLAKDMCPDGSFFKCGVGFLAFSSMGIHTNPRWCRNTIRFIWKCKDQCIVRKNDNVARINEATVDNR